MVLNGGYRLEITDNLYNALHRFRARRDRLQIWVDAVCINQCDIPERNQQVAMMGDIYRNARQVCIWLGEPQKLMVMHFLAAVNDLLHFRVDRQDRRWHGVRSTSKRRAIRDADAATSPSWCNRAWVRQEYVLAPSVYFLVGSLSLKRTSDAIDAVPALGVTLEQMDRLQSYPDMVTAIVNPWIVRQAKDPRDLVYSLRGIIRPEEAQLIQPDYSLPCEVVFAQATYAHIKAKGSFRILERFLAARPSSAPSLPSWVVDFSHIDRGVDIAGEVRWPCKRDFEAPLACASDSFAYSKLLPSPGKAAVRPPASWPASPSVGDRFDRLATSRREPPERSTGFLSARD